MIKKIHSVDNRIVSISQPYVRPVVRGKAKAATEFGAKLHLSVDETGFGRIEYLSFDAFNEGPMLIEALNSYRYRNGFDPKRVLVDKKYSAQDNIRFCNENGIRISGPKLGRPFKDEKTLRKNRKTMAKNNTAALNLNGISVQPNVATVWDALPGKEKILLFPRLQCPYW